MPDVVDAATRSRMMSGIRGKNTRPELVLRRALWRKGLRYNIHARNVLGKPDIVFRRSRIAVFVDGCFWHACPRHYNKPVNNADFWSNKITANKARRTVVLSALRRDGWKIVEIWECQVRDALERVVNQIAALHHARVDDIR